MKSLSLILLTILTLSGVVKAQEITSFNRDWKFQLSDQTGAEAINYDDSNWRELNLPHDWSIEGEYSEDAPMGGQCGYLPAGIGWYRKTITVPEEWKGKEVEIAFDGVFMNSTVWANGKELGFRPYGWISFGYDITDIVSESSTITFSVRVDNDKQPSARWYTGSGIYADTWIRVKDQVQIPTYGVTVTTDKNRVSVDVEVANRSDKGQKVSLISTIKDRDGVEVAKSSKKIKLTENSEQKVSLSSVVESPALWSLDNPNLYVVVNELKVGKKIVHREETTFGFRDIKWEPETGMWLNGENVKLQGICNHQDAGALGAAVPDKILRFRIQQLKDMGVNTIRTAHNPQTPQFYQFCDEIGMMVMDEIFDGWLKKAANDYGAHHFDEWWQQDLADWIRRDRNHPSIVIYSVGNETRGEVGKDIVELCHKLDSTRLVTSGHSGSEYMDVLGVNGHSEKKGWFEEMPSDKIFIGTENTHTWQVRGFYRTQTWYRDGYPNKRQKPYWYPDLTEEEIFTYDWTAPAGRTHFKQLFNSSYDNAMVRLNSRQNIEQLRDIPNYAGSFRWTGHDYIGEATYVHGGWPFKAFMGGAIDLANFEKDLFYLYQSQWTSKPMVHILPHWTHPTMTAGTEIPVWVYSNCDSVELFLNGKSLGEQKPGGKWSEMQCEWMVGYEPGELKAIGYKDGKVTVQEIIRTADAPSQIKLSVDGESMKSGINDIVQVRVTTADSKGEFYPYGENRSYFKVFGGGKVRALDNGSPIDVEKHFEASDRIAFFGLTRAYIESTTEEDAVTVLVGSILGEKKLITSKEISIDLKTLSLRGEAIAPNITVYYTADGSTPTTKSSIYKKPFEIELGTTVKALVLADGVEAFTMEERFAEDLGFVWDAVAVATNPGGDQAEDATFKGANISTKGTDFNGRGYLNFGRNAGGYVEWYQENDGSAGEFNLKIRYSASNWIRPDHKIVVNVNGKEQKFTLQSHKNSGSVWKVLEVPAQLGIGANTIRVTVVEDSELYIDELVVE